MIVIVGFHIIAGGSPRVTGPLRPCRDDYTVFFALHDRVRFLEHQRARNTSARRDYFF